MISSYVSTATHDSLYRKTFPMIQHATIVSALQGPVNLHELDPWCSGESKVVNRKCQASTVASKSSYTLRTFICASRTGWRTTWRTQRLHSSTTSGTAGSTSSSQRSIGIWFNQKYMKILFCLCMEPRRRIPYSWMLITHTFLESRAITDSQFPIKSLKSKPPTDLKYPKSPL